MWEMIWPMGGGGSAMVKSALESQAKIVGSNPSLAFKFQRDKMFPVRSLVKIQYYFGETLWPSGSVLSLRPQGLDLKFCVWRAVSPDSSHHRKEIFLVQFSLCAQRWPKTASISFWLMVNVFGLINYKQNNTTNQT